MEFNDVVTVRPVTRLILVELAIFFVTVLVIWPLELNDISEKFSVGMSIVCMFGDRLRWKHFVSYL